MTKTQLEDESKGINLNIIGPKGRDCKPMSDFLSRIRDYASIPRTSIRIDCRPLVETFRNWIGGEPIGQSSRKRGKRHGCGLSSLLYWSHHSRL